MGKFAHHRYTYVPTTWGTKTHKWELVGPNGAVHFHVSEIKTGDELIESCGLEFHSLSGKGAPDHLDCPLTGGRCWHEGTSLYAGESLWPMIKPMLLSGDHASVFHILETEYEQYFEKE